LINLSEQNNKYLVHNKCGQKYFIREPLHRRKYAAQKVLMKALISRYFAKETDKRAARLHVVVLF